MKLLPLLFIFSLLYLTLFTPAWFAIEVLWLSIEDIDDVEILCSLVKGSWIVARKLRVTGPMRPR